MVSRLETLIIHNKQFDPHFCPFHGHVRCSYNGTDFIIRVNGLTIHTCAKTREHEFCIEQEVVEPSQLSWNQIVHKMLQGVIVNLTQQAMNEQVFLQSEGMYYEQ